MGTGSYDVEPHEYAVVSYTRAELEKLCAGTEPTQTERPQLYQIHALLKEKATHIVVEREYVDQAFLEDHGAYYGRCFAAIPTRCVRLHFFQKPFSPTSWQKYLEQVPKNPAKFKRQLERSYLGNVVVKPLPKHSIGRTTLIPPDNNEAFLARTCKVHLAGLTLEFQGLAFQEQDHAVSACATAALWTSLHKLSGLFHFRLPSPSAITAHAGKIVSDSRTLPSSGLNIYQMSQAIKALGFDVETRTGRRLTDFKGLIRAYAHYGLAPILIVREVSGGPEDLHAVTVAGLSSKIRQTGRNVIEHLWLHDDQRGPYYPVKVSKKLTIEPKTDNKIWNHKKWELHSIMIPVYHKIRIPYEMAKTQIEELRELFIAYGVDPEWELVLTDVNVFKEQSSIAPGMSPADRNQILCESFPRFMWHASARYHGDVVCQVLLDCTGVPDSTIAQRIFIHDDNLGTFLRRVLEDTDAASDLRNMIGEKWVTLIGQACGASGSQLQ